MQLVERRIGLLFAVFLLALAIGATKAAWLGVVKAGPLKRAAVTQQEADITIPARRGTISDVHGNDLAVSEPAYDIAASTYLIPDVNKAAAQISPLIGVPEDELLKKLATRTNFVYVGRGIPGAKADQLQKLKIPGLTYIPRYKRDYPLDWTASQLLGSTGTDDQGLGGLEFSLEKQLTGTDGERRVVKDAMGQPIEMRDTKPVRPGHNVRLTLDANIQERAEDVLKEVGEQWKPKGATAIVMDPNTGAILALANWPRSTRTRPRRTRRSMRAGTARSQRPTSPAPPSRRSPSRPRWRTGRSRPIRRSTSRRSSRSPTARSRTPRLTATSR